MRLEMVGLFLGMTEKTRHAVAALASEEALERGNYLFQAGEPAADVYVLKQGRVRVKMGAAGHVAIILCDTGDLIGWAGMAGLASHFASAECLDSVKVWKFDNAALRALLEADPISGMHFYRVLAEVIGRRLVASYGATVAVQGERHPKYWG